MTRTIHILDEQAANQIAAGEVVERPLSVVKELIENALDAEASRIEISVEGNGVPYISVIDNGQGIPSAQLPLAILRHATSKITRIEDLHALNTLGFRGEALPSIASVSALEIHTRYREELSGTSLKVQGGNEPILSEIGRSEGTTVIVRNLFYNTPARLKFLKSVNTEFGLISDMVSRLALARPDVAFTLTHPQHIVLKTPGRGKLLEAVAAVLGQKIALSMIPVSFNNGIWGLEGYVSPPDLVRSNRQGENFIVNGRVIRSGLFSRALKDAYHTMVPAKLNPIAVLQLTISPAEYDVNVHPAKQEVRFAREQELAQFITEGIRKVLQSHNSPTPLKFESPNRIKSEEKLIVSVNSENNPEMFNITTSSTVKKTILNDAAMEARAEYPTKIVNKESTIKTANIEQALTQRTIFSPTPALIPETTNQLNVWPLGQIFNTYLLATDGSSLFIIDQHAAHERINYERLLKKMKESKPGCQELLIPIPIEFTLQEEQILLEHLWTLREFGFILEHFGPQTYLLRGIPDNIQSGEGEKLVRQFLDKILKNAVAPNFESLREEWAYLMACRNSIKAQESLTLSEMEQLITQLNFTENPYTCPHGRPTIVQISKSELEKRFYRTS